MVKSAWNLFPDGIHTVHCNNDGGDAKGVTDPSIICKTKKKTLEIAEYDDKGKLMNKRYAKVPVDCVAHKI